MVASAIALWGWLRPSAPGAPAIAPTRIDLALERPTGGPGRRIAISPDGRWIAYAGGPGEPLQVRRADETEVRALAGTEGGAQPEFSPDGSWISFAEAGNLYRVPVDGGPALLVYRAGTASSPSWGVDGLIYFVESGELRRVREDGGAAETLPAEGSNVRHPVPLPDASGVLFTEGAFTDANVRLLDLETGEVRPLVSSGAHARYVPTGHLVYGHESQALMAVPFDLARHEVTGSPEPLLNGVGVAADGATQFAVSDAGTAVYLGAGVTAQLGLALVDTAGEIEMLPVLAQPFRPSPRFSPDGHRIAFDDRSQIYTFDLDMGTSAPLTFQGANFYAVWSRDARTLVHRGEGGLHRVPVDGSRRSEPLTEPLVVGVPHAWSPDGVRVLYRAGPGQNLHVLTLGDSAVSTPYLTGDWNEWAAALSPDGAFAAYASDESGSFEVYVRSFPTPGARHQVSVGGGAEPVWAPDGTRIYYRQGDALLAAGVALEPDFRVLGHDTVLADVSGFARFPSFASYDVHPDGDRFVFFRREEGGDAVGGSAVLTVVVGWFDELRARLGS